MSKEQMLAEIEEFYRQGEIQPDDLTTEDVSKKLGVSKETARVVMRKLVAAGKYTVADLRVRGHVRRVYRKQNLPAYSQNPPET